MANTPTQTLCVFIISVLNRDIKQSTSQGVSVETSVLQRYGINDGVHVLHVVPVNVLHYNNKH